MKAIILTEAGSPDNLKLQQVDTPQPKEDEVLIKIKTISINPVDVKTRKGGGLLEGLQKNPLVILGWDVAGDVVAVGASVTKFKESDKVFGMINFPGKGKTYAEYATAPEAHLAHIPDGINYEEAAAATLAALTAWQVLVHQAEIRAGQRVLIHAAAGGVGHFAVQIAKHFDAFVIGTASAANSDFLKSLGVDQTVDYTREDFSQTLKDIDIVLDPIGGATTIKSLRVLKPGGTLVSIVGGVKEEAQSIAGDSNFTAKNYLVHSSGRDMEQLAILLKEGKLKPFISSRYTLEQMPEAHRKIETGKTRGKIVVNVG
ncbi:NADP-dependent oxidoreductase [Flavisolibacter ginsenosidimutans]|uniref:NADP-dependent oxidoreductase n=1 Tax=Flavisolibacter ginsenosidimutans TaxID=661481 RepID=A0A5B8UL49_9BACT|nr:NADP-dependent oxidoreductase [Flavisolibacter ginsenosidimutans]QEC56760.1 NADP-dependent oxidoreductase [Flavisolibacter ginsenosidimutans]